MSLHKFYDLILSAPATPHKLNDMHTPHLSFKQASEANKQSPKGLLQVPKWDRKKKQNVDQVKLDMPGINMDDVDLFVSDRDLIVSVLRYNNNGNSRSVHCEYFFKMLLADDIGSDAVTSNYSDGILTIEIPHVQKKVKKIIPAFAYNNKVGMDEVKLELVGVKSGDIEYEVEDRIITVRGFRYDESDGEESLEVEYFFTIRASANSDLSAIYGSSNAGVFTLMIPRKPEHVQEVEPVHIHEQKPEVDIVKVELPGTKNEDIKIDIISKYLYITAERFDGEGSGRVLKTVYKLYMGFPYNNDLEEMTRQFDNGILTLSIPRHVVDLTERAIALRRANAESSRSVYY